MDKINILLACQNGMSTGIIKNKIAAEAQQQGFTVNVTAVGMSELKKEAANYDIVLLAPQIRYALKSIEKELNGITKYMLIDSIDFGKMDGASVFNKLTKVLSE